MKLFKNEEEAVSPVIGVILMVAIVVILAAVIAAFVFGMAGNVQSTKAVGATATAQGLDTIFVTYVGGKDAPDVTEIRATVTPEDPQAAPTSIPADGSVDASDSGGTAGDPVPVGEVIQFTATAGEFFGGKDHVVVIATFADKTEQVILDTYI